MSAARKVLIADDDAAIRMVLGQAFTRAGYEVRVTASARTLVKWAGAGEGDLAITDVLMPDENALDVLPRLQSLRPDLPVIVISAQNTLLTAVKATQVGAFDYLPKPFDLADVLAVAERALARPGAAAAARAQIKAEQSEHLPLLGGSPAMQAVYGALARLVDSPVPVLVTGESGVGKALTARTLYDLAKGRKGPLVTVSLAGLTAARVERELIGEAEAPGAIARADGGALVLGKVDDLPLEGQSALLRIVDDALATPAGRRPRVRLIATSGTDLAHKVRDGRFREDLYYRLNVAEVTLPPLRERVEDVPDLAQAFLLRSHREGLPAKTFEPAALKRLQVYGWPGNVRELENLVRRLVVLYPENLISARAVDRELTRRPGPAAAPGEGEAQSLEQLVEAQVQRQFRGAPDGLPEPGLYRRTLEEVERALFRVTLAAVGGNQLKAAKVLGVNRNTLHTKLGLLDLDPRQGRGGD